MKHIPQRMCVACRKMYPQNELIRLVRDNKTGEIKFDCDKKLFGRGAYICAWIYLQEYRLYSKCGEKKRD